MLVQSSYVYSSSKGVEYSGGVQQDRVSWSRLDQVIVHTKGGTISITERRGPTCRGSVGTKPPASR